MERAPAPGLEAGRDMRPAGAEPPAAPTERVWDTFVRLFHWSLVVLFASAFATSDTYEDMHTGSGYAILALVVARVLWGFVGPVHARFADFVRTPGAVLRYLRDAVMFRAPRYLGHNPAGGAMVVALLLTLPTIVASGVMMTMDRFWGQKWIEEVHATAAYGALGLIALHVAGVVFASLEHRENLVKSMFTGTKKPNPPSQEHTPS